jgi:hypothetical protein
MWARKPVTNVQVKKHALGTFVVNPLVHISQREKIASKIVVRRFFLRKIDACLGNFINVDSGFVLAKTLFPPPQKKVIKCNKNPMVNMNLAPIFLLFLTMIYLNEFVFVAFFRFEILIFCFREPHDSSVLASTKSTPPKTSPGRPTTYLWTHGVGKLWHQINDSQSHIRSIYVPEFHWFAYGLKLFLNRETLFVQIMEH